MRLSSIVFALVLSQTACSSDGGATAEGACASDTAGIQATLFANRCATSGCHSSADQAEGLDLQSPGLEGRLVNVPAAACGGSTLVVPGNPDASFVYQKVSVTKPKCGARMPFGEAALSSSELECMRNWISHLSASDAGPSDATSDAPSCPTGEAFCGGKCISVANDPANCGACGKSCGAGTCAGGTCACASGLTLCASGCVDTKSDAKNCGTCGMACGAGLVCAGGACSSTCPSGTMNCGGSCVDVTSNAANCGACGKACPSGTTCSAGKCTCPTGTTMCGTTCVNTATDAANCGMCGHACATGQVCSGSTCSCGASVSFSGQVQPIFTASCAKAGCHTGIKPAASMNLSSGSAYGALVNVASSSCSGLVRVSPGNVSKSYLINKLTGVGMCSGTQMPKTGASLASSQLDLIRGWICNGAPKN